MASHYILGPPVPIEPGQSLGIDASWLHRCQHCGHVWFSADRRPLQCAAKNTRVPELFCAVKLWHGGYWVEDAITVDGGMTRPLPGGRFLHRCGKCAYLWLSDTINPSTCSRRRRGNIEPCRSGEWRMQHPEYIAQNMTYGELIAV